MRPHSPPLLTLLALFLLLISAYAINIEPFEGLTKQGILRTLLKPLVVLSPLFLRIPACL